MQLTCCMVLLFPATLSFDSFVCVRCAMACLPKCYFSFTRLHARPLCFNCPYPTASRLTIGVQLFWYSTALLAACVRLWPFVYPILSRGAI